MNNQREFSSIGNNFGYFFPSPLQFTHHFFLLVENVVVDKLFIMKFENIEKDFQGQIFSMVYFRFM